ncbi:MAG: hypothetical protein WC458_02890 [Patescibacteria group bacterium]
MAEVKVKKLDTAIKDLILWDENARFPDKYFSRPEEELIDYFCAKKDFKIFELAEEIVKDFDLPQIEKIIVYEIGDDKIVLEGNRRLAVYKLLSNPNLLNDINLRNKFIELKTKINIDDNFELECLVTNDVESGLRYIDRKHLNGNNEVHWGDNERAHHKARRGSASQKELLKVAITRIIRELDFPEEFKEQVLGPGYVTTLWRLIEQTPAWDIFGFTLDEDGNLDIKDKDFKEKLKVIIFDVLQKIKFNEKLFSRLNTKEIDSYLKSISDNDFKRVAEYLKGETKKDLFGNEKVVLGGACENSKRSNPKSCLRNYLIPRTCTFVINETKINNIYSELKNNLLIDDSKNAVPNAVGVLFRVFLEISIDYFWAKNGFNFKDDTKLAGKITTVADYMEKTNMATGQQLKNIRTVATDKNNLLAIENFHNYVHSYKSQPSSSDLKLKWDNLQEFFKILWESLKSKK